jgi:hypothetical protein
MIFTPHLLVVVTFALTISPLLLPFCLELHVLLVEAMEEERSLIIDIVGDMSKAPLLEALTASSSSDTSSGGATSNVAKAEAEDGLDPR